MAVHKITAKDDKSKKKGKEQPETTASPALGATRRTAGLSHKRSEEKPEKIKKEKTSRRLPKPLRIILTPIFLIGRPFRRFGRYVLASHKEIRQVRWPDRKLTWKLTFAVIAFIAIFATFIMLLDLLYSSLFNLILK